MLRARRRTIPVATETPRRSAHYWQQTLQNRMLVVVLCMTVVVPLLASPSNLAMQHAAIIALRLMAALLAGILVLRAHSVSNRAEVLGFLKTGANLPILLFLSASLLTTLFAQPPIRTLGLIQFMGLLAGVLLYFAVAYHIRRSEHLVKMLDALTLLAGVMAVLALLAFMLKNNGSAYADFLDVTLLSAFLVALFPITLSSAFTGKEAKRQSRAQITAALVAFGLATSGSPSAWVAALIEIVVLAILSQVASPNRHQLRERRKQIILPLIIAIIGMALAALLSLRGSTFTNHYLTSTELASRSAQHRVTYAAREMLKARPLLGYGPGSFPIVQDQYVKNFQTAASSRRTDYVPTLWLRLAAEQGLFGVLLFGAIVLVFLGAGIHRLNFMEPGIRRSLLLACLTAGAGIAVDAYGNPAWAFAQIAMFFWLTLGLGVAALVPRNRR